MNPVPPPRPRPAESNPIGDFVPPPVSLAPVLVTGGTGFLGRRLVERLRLRG